MKLLQLSDSCYAVVHARHRACDANSGLVNLGGGVVIDTQGDLGQARRMIELFGKVWPGMPKRVINTHEDSDHVWGNQLFAGAEIIAHRTVPERMRDAADAPDARQLLEAVGGALSGRPVGVIRPDALAIASQGREAYEREGIALATPTTVFDRHHVLDLDGTEVLLTHVGPSHQFGDTIVHVPSEGVLFAGDVVFRECTPVGWAGTSENWLAALDLIIGLDPEVIVPGHGPVCGIEGAMEMKAYLEYVREEAERFFRQGLTALEASIRIDLGPYGTWRAPARLYLNVERAYREFRGEPPDAPCDAARSFAAIREMARARGIAGEI